MLDIRYMIPKPECAHMHEATLHSVNAFKVAWFLCLQHSINNYTFCQTCSYHAYILFWYSCSCDQTFLKILMVFTQMAAGGCGTVRLETTSGKLLSPLLPSQLWASERLWRREPHDVADSWYRVTICVAASVNKTVTVNKMIINKK